MLLSEINVKVLKNINFPTSIELKVKVNTDRNCEYGTFELLDEDHIHSIFDRVWEKTGKELKKLFKGQNSECALRRAVKQKNDDDIKKLQSELVDKNKRINGLIETIGEWEDFSKGLENTILDKDKEIERMYDLLNEENERLKTALRPFVKFMQEADEIPASAASAYPVLGLTWHDFIEAEKALKG